MTEDVLVLASCTWSTRREGNAGYVLEVHPDGTSHEFGPMPAHTVPAFVQARRTLISHMMSTIGVEPTVPEDYSHLADLPTYDEPDPFDPLHRK